MTEKRKIWLPLMAGCLLAGLVIGCESTSSSSGTLTITPASVYISAGKVNVVTLIASGGDGNYSWSVSSTNLGAIFAAGTNAVYQSSTNSGVNTVIATDGNADQGSSVITQE